MLRGLDMEIGLPVPFGEVLLAVVLELDVH